MIRIVSIHHLVWGFNYGGVAEKEVIIRLCKYMYAASSRLRGTTF